MDHGLEKKVERLRKDLYELYKEDPTNPEVVKLSQELDELLNLLHKMDMHLS
ncbi:aspartyl-phosphate phosphatase Spo0E family protein [Halobacillus yeomjeoni]|uniref:Aspartyl-phosphate phosphatase Spo0E family protein n=1 Tax=Halobacillus yeomjeoni TaxID=311194 RepID=A0A931MUE7_9BACI|nr:aspartyl-phosphate phosphatase Spo0E family protein [Halobacillus yeomjeoni]MBH0229199.1 aspartyl-phosphate phosphatase Spo0E family protein [Halobacillus yeomjeoni]